MKNKYEFQYNKLKELKDLLLKYHLTFIHLLGWLTIGHNVVCE